jgi:hypothetical protein
MNASHSSTTWVCNREAIGPCHVRARTGGKLRSPMVTHGEYEKPSTWASAG